MDPKGGSNDYKPEDVQKWVEQTLAGLQLPHMPRPSNGDEEPTIQILLVSDVDLASASALAEFTLLQDNKVFDASRIDLCIACGPFCHDEDMIPYLKGKQRKNYHKLYDSEVDSSNPSWSSSVFFRSPEETAALEGLVTAAISQLESIVCRVVFCPGSSDPLTSSTLPTELRFTPNSRNIHRKWLPLAPGLGCSGLLFLDTPNKALQLRSPKRMQGKSMGYNDESCSDEDLEEDEHYGDPRNGDKTVTFTNVHGNEELGADNYCRTLESLINLAPPPQEHYRFDSPKSQTILVTHYFNIATKYRNPGEEETENLKSHIKHAPDRNEDSQPMPWPEEHTDFVESTLAQEELPLEIASGHGAGLLPRHLKQGKVDLVIPGSLRERGEFCLVSMCLSERAKKEKSPKVKPSFAWRVSKVEFHNMNRLP